ncbi:MAG: hypothetical protein ABIB61_02250 [Candidatus Shapirobacteria bacterium]
MRKALTYFFFFQLLLAIGWSLGNSILPLGPSTYLGRGNEELKKLSFFWSRANFDGLHYLGISRWGYGHLQQAFFPFFPKLISLFHKLVSNYLLSGIFISNLFLLLCFWLFPKLLAQGNIKGKIIEESTLFYFFFPTAFFFGSVYTESLFLFLVLLTFYLAKKGKFLGAGIAAGLASYTRLVGIFLLPALLLEYYEQFSKRRMKERIAALKERITSYRKSGFAYLIKSRARHFKFLAFILFSASGLLFYMNYLLKTTGSALFFLEVQAGFGAQRSVTKLILLYQVFWRYLKMIFTVAPYQWIYFNVWFEFIIALIFLFLLLWGWYKRREYKIKSSWLLFASLSCLLPSLTGTFSSLPRYVLVCFPCFIVLAHLSCDLAKKHRLSWLPKAYWILNLLLFIFICAFFFRGFWVA